MEPFPVMRKGSVHKATFGDAPVVWIDTWKDVSLDFLAKSLPNNSTIPPKQVLMEHWLEVFDKFMAKKAICV